QQRNPPAHRRADQHLRPLAAGLEHREAVLEPAADRAVGEIASRLAVAGIVEPHAGAIFLRGEAVERLRLGPLHVRFESAKPNEPRPPALALPYCDATRIRGGSNVEEFQARVVHTRSGSTGGWSMASVAAVLRRRKSAGTA